MNESFIAKLLLGGMKPNQGFQLAAYIEPRRIAPDFERNPASSRNRASIHGCAGPRHHFEVPKERPASRNFGALSGDLRVIPRTAVIVFSREREILVETGMAETLLRCYFPDDFPRLTLPPFLYDWLSNLADSGTPELTIDRDDHRLIVTLVTEPSLTVLILTEQRRPMTPEVLRGFGLTTRESQVMGLVIEGKTNWEIGQILEMSHRTVGKHMEHVLQKLGAENRVTAIRMAMEKCGL